jgi:hypothetical protein
LVTCYEIASAYECGRVALEICYESESVSECGRYAGREICYEIESVSEGENDVPPRRLQRRCGDLPMGFDFDLLLLLDGLVGWIPGWGTHYYACEGR